MRASARMCVWGGTSWVRENAKSACCQQPVARATIGGLRWLPALAQVLLEGGLDQPQS